MNPTSGIPTWFVDQFAKTFTHVLQQRESKIASRVRRETISGEDKSIDAISSFSMTKRASRHQETNWTDPSSQRRWLDWATYDTDVMVDNQDKLSMLVDPTSEYLNGMRMAANRQMDNLVIDAAFASVTSGRDRGSTISWADTKFTGTNHDTEGLIIEHDTGVHGASGTSSSLTPDKLRLVREIFAAKDVPDEMPIYIVVNPVQVWNGLMKYEEYINADYSVRKALAEGAVAPFAGVEIIQSTLITLDTTDQDKDGDTDVYHCIAMTGDGLALGVAEEPAIKVAELPEHEFNIGLHLELGMGAVRADEDKVIDVECI